MSTFLFSLACAAAIASQAVPPTPVGSALPNDNRVAAGRLAKGVLTLELEAREVNWYPEEASGTAIPVYGFAEGGRRVRVPGPMIRVPAGTELHVTVRNLLPKSMRLRGLQDRASAVLDSVVISRGATHVFRFRVDIPGTYYYWGRTEALPPIPEPGVGQDALLNGVFIVDPVGTKPLKGERVFVITLWSDTLAGSGGKSDRADRVLRRELVSRDRWLLGAVNGRSWPHTERLSYTVGDTIHWRVINASPAPHPMHLHGFYFDVDARGDGQRDTVFTPAQRRQAVTEWMTRGTTMAMTWVPSRAGNWLFHCHLVTHIAETNRLSHAEHDPGMRRNHAESGMTGLVLGVRVAPARSTASAPDPKPRRALRVFVTERARVYGDQPGFSYILQEGPTPPASDSIRIPSSFILLHQNEPTEITVINASSRVATIHWHGLELESFYDGVGDWSGWGTRIAPAIAPGDSFVVRVTPQRAGTFIYHTHTDEAIGLPSGLYGTLIVLPEHVPPDTTERVFLLGIGGPLEDALPVVNGSTTPPPIELRAGIAHRFRFINISPLESHTVQLMSGGTMQQWRAVAKDGADLPAQQATAQPGVVALHPGETYDFEVLRQAPESLTMKIISPETITNRLAARARGTSRDLLPRIVTEIPVVVRQ
jgi:manganese oxidase